MALSGEFSNYPVSGFGLYCTWSATQSITGNYSDVTLKVYLKYYSLYVGERADSTVSINGRSETYTVAAISESSNTAHTKLLKTKTVRVSHNADGTKTGVALSASWRFDGTYSSTSIGTITASATISLDSIDRTAPTVAFSTSNITANGFTLSATSSATADIWQYSINAGTSWTSFSTTAGTSASVTLSSLSPNTTYSVKVRARKKSNQVYGTSSAVSVKTLGGAVINSAAVLTADNATVTITVNVTVYDASYSNTLAIKNGSTTYLTISGLSWTKGTADRTITLTSSQRTTLLSAMASLKSFTGTFAVSTFSGSTQIGSTSTAAAKVQTTALNSAPILDGFSYRDSYSVTTAVTGDESYFIQGYSILTVTPGTATARNGASISSYSATCNGVTYSNTTGGEIILGPVSKSGTVTVMLTATDSRGYTAVVARDITVIPYEKPKLTSISLRRTNEIETEMQLIFNGSFSPITISGTAKNSLKYVRYRYKLTSAESYSSYTSILSSLTVSGSSFSYSNLELCNLDADKSYDFHLQIRDKLNSYSSTDLYFVVSQGTPLVALRKGMVGINTPEPQTALHIVGDATVDGGMTVSDNILPDTANGCSLGSSSYPFSSLSGKYHRLYANGKSYGFVYVNTIGTDSTVGEGRLTLGNSTAEGTEDNAMGRIALYGSGSKYHIIAPGANTANYTHTLPQSAGYLVSSGSTSSAVGGTAKPVYITASGEAAALSSTVGGTTRPVYLSSGTITGITAVALAYGGTGATTAAAARTNLGVAVTSLYSGTLTTGSTTFNYGNYNFYIIIGQPSTASARCCFVIPKAQITTSAVSYRFADETNYYTFKLSYSSSTVTLAYSSRSSTGQILNVYGVN